MFWSGVLRFCKALIAATPFLIAGLCTAGVMRGMIGARRLNQLLGGNHWTGPIRGWLLGLLLPICALGALPVARELRRAGIPSGTVLSFVLVAPVLNPISVVFGLSHIAAYTLGYFVVGTLVVSLGIGFIWNAFISPTKDALPSQFERPSNSAFRRLGVAGLTATRGLVGPDAVDLTLALLTVGLMGAFLPYGVLQKGLTPDNPYAPIIMAAVAIPAYVTPFDVMMHFGLIVRDGYSLGAAFALIVLGAGSNVGVANWIRRDYGTRALGLFLAMLLGTTLMLGYGADRTIVRGNAKPTDHTHAFDSFTRVYQVPADEAGVSWVYKLVVRDIRFVEIFGLTTLGGMALVGVAGRFAGKWADPEALLQASPHQPVHQWNPELPAWMIGGLAASGIVAMGIGLTYVFYPPPKAVLDDLAILRVGVYDAIREGDPDEVIRRGFQWEDMVRKLPTSQFIRTGRSNPELRVAVDDMLYALDLLHDFAETEDIGAAKAIQPYLEQQHGRCRACFRQ